MDRSERSTKRPHPVMEAATASRRFARKALASMADLGVGERRYEPSPTLAGVANAARATGLAFPGADRGRAPRIARLDVLGNSGRALRPPRIPKWNTPCSEEAPVI